MRQKNEAGEGELKSELLQRVDRELVLYYPCVKGGRRMLYVPLWEVAYRRTRAEVAQISVLCSTMNVIS
jgi:hypothetical protein